MSNHYLNLSGLSKFLDLIKGIFATTEQGDKADSAYTHSQSPHAPSNAERNTIVGIQKNGTDLTPNSSTRKVNVTVPTKVSELTNDSGYKTTDNNTTYTITKSGSTITLEGSDGTSSSVSDSNTTYTLSSFGVTATAAELNKLDGVTATATELNYIDGVTSNIQTQLNGKAASSHTHTGTQVTGLTASRALVSNSGGQVSVSGVTSTELGYLDGVTSGIQSQLNSKASSSHTHNYAGSSSAGGAANSAVKLQTARTINGVSFDGSAAINIPNNHFVSLSSQDLDEYITYGEYYGGGSNDVSNKPPGVDWFYLRIFRTASGYTAQHLYSAGIWYNRYYKGSSWTDWADEYSSNNKPSPSDIGAAASSHTHFASQVTGLTASRALISSSSGTPTVSAVTSTELGYLDGVTSNIQTQLNGKAALSHTHTGTQVTGLTASRALVSNSSGQVTVSAVTSTELGYLDGVTSNIQTQLSGKASSSHTHSASNITSGTLGIARGGTGGTTAASARANLDAVGLIVSDVEPEDQNVGDIWFMEETVDE